ncbi:MAG: choice-of-anchor J domain-containing protein [Bacteroidales bacterium]|nr:choice-of-anchor J domain-containing protein [Bacteroidales bacterium]
MKKLSILLLVVILCSVALITSCKEKPTPEPAVELQEIVFTNVTDDAITLTEGETFTLRYELIPEGVDEDIEIEWYSEDEDIVTIDNCIIEAVSVGETFICAIHKNVEAYLYVSVVAENTEIEVEGINFTNITDGELIIHIGDIFDVEYELLPEGVDQTLAVEWYSDNETIATVENGSIEGLAEGQTTITAVCNDVEASFTLNVNKESGEVGNNILLMEDFNDGFPDGWRTLDSDGDGYTWRLGYEIFYFFNGIDNSELIMSQSYCHQDGILTPDNYLISPEFVIPSTGYWLSWYTGAADSQWYQEHYTVYVQVDGENVEIFDQTLSTYSFNFNQVDLSDFAGKTVSIIFRHHDIEDMYHFGIDNILVANYEVSWPSTPGPKAIIEYDFNDGVFPADWTTEDADGDGFTWDLTSNVDEERIAGIDDTDCLVSASFKYWGDSPHGLTPDNWLHLEPVQLDYDDTFYLRFYVGVIGKFDSTNEHYSVYVNGEEVLSETLPENFDGFEYRSVNLRRWAGEIVEISFRHHDCVNEFALLIDNLSISNYSYEPGRTSLSIRNLSK